MQPSLPRWARILLGAGLPAAIAAACLYLYRGGTGLRCLFYSVTGLYCPGCGSGRAVAALLHGRFRRAVSYNILLFILGIPAAGVFGHEFLRLLFPRLKLRPVYLSQTVQIVCAALIFAFWVLRNIPAFSFLAPG